MTDFDVETPPRRFPALALTHDGRPMVESLAPSTAPTLASRMPATV